MEIKIRLLTMKQVKEFVGFAEKCDYDIDISYNRVVIDAKSILGILSMDLSKVLIVKCYGDDCEEFFNNIEKFAVSDAVA